MKNPDVFLQQLALKSLGFYTGELDGISGPMTLAARKAWEIDIAQPGVRTVKASSFADPEDVRRFKACKARGNSDQVCFRTGDNGIGKWGDLTTTDVPMCALPREDWQHLGMSARGAKVRVTANGRQVVCELRDTMPSRANIKNGAGLDLNPAAVHALGLSPPIMIAATWEWV